MAAAWYIRITGQRGRGANLKPYLRLDGSGASGSRDRAYIASATGPQGRQAGNYVLKWDGSNVEADRTNTLLYPLSSSAKLYLAHSYSMSLNAARIPITDLV